MILQDLVQDLTKKLKVFLATIFETSCQELIKNLSRYSQYRIGIYIQYLGKIKIRSYIILHIYL